MVKTSVHFYEVLHGFHDQRGTVMSIMELMMAQEIYSIYQEPLFLFFMNPRNTYDILEHGCLMKTLEE